MAATMNSRSPDSSHFQRHEGRDGTATPAAGRPAPALGLGSTEWGVRLVLGLPCSVPAFAGQRGPCEPAVAGPRAEGGGWDVCGTAGGRGHGLQTGSPSGVHVLWAVLELGAHGWDPEHSEFMIIRGERDAGKMGTMVPVTLRLLGCHVQPVPPPNPPLGFYFLLWKK